MSKPSDAKSKWNATFADSVNISDLRTAVRRAPQLNPCVAGYRSVCWKAFLLHQNIDRRGSWAKTGRDSRGAYASLKEHLLRDLGAAGPREGGGGGGGGGGGESSATDPLAEGAAANAAAAYEETAKEDEALRAEILQDVERCMPEIPLFRRDDIRHMLLNVLFVYCKINADLGYRQGMHELLAPLIWVLHEDAVSFAAAAAADSEAKPGEGIAGETLDPNFIEHDAFSLFCIIMQTAKAFYEMVSATRSPGAGAGAGAGESPIVERSKRIHEEYLQKADPELAEHLTSIDILPQIFVIRWIRLLFGREFPFQHVLALWDMIFAEDPALTLVDHICLAMLLRVRWQLLEADYSTALTLLLRYPEPGSAEQTAALVSDAVYLSKHMDLQGGSTIIRKYTGKAPLAALAQAGGEPVKRRGSHTPHSSVDLNKAFRPLRSPADYIQNQGGLEAILQGAAKNVYSRSEQWGLNKAIRGAVQNLQNNTLSPPRQVPGRSRWSLDDGGQVSDTTSIESDFKALERRNAQLAKMLHEAIGELSEQSSALEAKEESEASNALTLTVAKLQYLQVHLADSQLPLDSDSPSGAQQPGARRSPPPSPTPASRAGTANRPQPPANRIEKPTPSINVLHAEPASLPTSQDLAAAASTANPAPTKRPAQRRAPGNFAQPRPSLHDSSYSWMLGGIGAGEDDRLSASFSSSSALSPGHEREEMVKKKSAARSRAGFLFGDKDDDGGGDGKKRSSSKASKRAEKTNEDDDGFTMGTLTGGPVK